MTTENNQGGWVMNLQLSGGYLSGPKYCGRSQWTLFLLKFYHL